MVLTFGHKRGMQEASSISNGSWVPLVLSDLVVGDCDTSFLGSFFSIMLLNFEAVSLDYKQFHELFCFLFFGFLKFFYELFFCLVYRVTAFGYN